MRKLLLAMLALAACADSNSSGNPGGGPDPGGGGGGGGGSGDVSDADKQQDYNDVAASIGANLSAADLPSMVDAVNMAYGRMPAGYTITQKTDTLGTTFDLVAGARGGVTVQYKLYCRDGADVPTTCNGVENHAHVKPVYAGSITGSAMTIDSIQRAAAWIVRDVTLPSARLGGSGTDTFSSHLATGDYQLMAMDTLKNALFDPTAPSTPSAGTLDLTINIQRTRTTATPADRSFAVTAHVQFTGPDAATLTLDGSQNYTLTVSSGAVAQ